MTKAGEKNQSDILAVLRQQGRAMSAYDLLAELRQSKPKIAPPTVYRALAALTEGGRVHRLESLNAYIACRCESHQQASIMSICDDCGAIEESIAPDLLNKISSVASQSGFAPSHHVVELHGLCASCGNEPTGA